MQPTAHRTDGARSQILMKAPQRTLRRSKGWRSWGNLGGRRGGAAKRQVRGYPRGLGLIEAPTPIHRQGIMERYRQIQRIRHNENTSSTAPNSRRKYFLQKIPKKFEHMKECLMYISKMELSDKTKLQVRKRGGRIHVP